MTFQGLSFFNGLGYDHSLSFVNPSSSLTIEAGSGGDTITVKSLDPAFAADLLLYGNKAGAPTIEPDAGKDARPLRRATSCTHGGYLEVFADKIFVDRRHDRCSTLTDQADLEHRQRHRRSARAASARPRSRTCCRRAT